MGVAQKPRSWPRWVNFTPALVGHFYIGGDINALRMIPVSVNSDSGMLNTVSGKEGQSVQVEPE